MRRDSIDKPWRKRGPECTHPIIVPVDEHWGKCTSCGDSTFPMSASAAWGCDEDVELVGDDASDRQTRGAVAAYIRELEGIPEQIADWLESGAMYGTPNRHDLAEKIRAGEWRHPETTEGRASMDRKGEADE